MTSFYKKEINLVGELKPSRLYIGEGETEAYFIDKFLSLRNASPLENCVLCIRGLSRFQKKLEVISKQDNFRFVESLCFMLDAEDSPNGRLDAIIDGCRRMGFIELRNIETTGIYTKNGKSLGVIVSPGTGERGRIEDLILQEISAKEEYSCIQRYVECLASDNSKTLDAKSVVQTYISAINGGLCGAGRAFQAGILDPMDSAYGSASNIIDALI